MTATQTSAPLAANASESAIIATGMRKSYGDKLVPDGVDLAIAKGTIFALLGPNGAGKTTTVEILSTPIDTDAGAAWVAGRHLTRAADEMRSAIGVTGQFSAVDNLLTAEDNLLLMADLRHLDRREGKRKAKDLLCRFDLSKVAGKTAVTFSGSMRRKLDLAMTLVGDPRIIFLDEPTTGLDPRSRRTMWQIIRDPVTDDGVTIFPTTQHFEEAAQLAERIAALGDGRLIVEGTADELKQRIPGGHIRCGSPTSRVWTPPRASSASPRATRTPSPCRSPATAPSPTCRPSSTPWSPRPSRPSRSPCTPPTSSTFS